MHIETLEIGGLGAALKAMRLPYNSSDKSDSQLCSCHYQVGDYNDLPNGSLRYSTNVDPILLLGLKDRILLSKLIKNGDEHGKAARGIIVWAEITAPRYWWQEMDTYRIGTDCLSSESTMHKECRGLSGVKLQKAKAEIKEGLLQKRIRTFSYQCLRRIYFQRRKHQLPEWDQVCKWIEGLPFSKDFITVEK